MADIKALDGQVLELLVSMHKGRLGFTPEFVNRDPLIYDEPKVESHLDQQGSGAGYEPEDWEMNPYSDDLDYPRGRPEVPGGSMRIFRAENPRSAVLREGECWRVKVLGASANPGEEHTRDNRRKIYIRVEILERVETVSEFRPEWYDKKITRFISSGKTVVRREELPAEFKTVSYRLKTGEVLKVQEMAAGEYKFYQYAGQVDENTYLNRLADDRRKAGLKNIDLKNLQRLYRELPEASGELIRRLYNECGVLIS